MTSLGEPPAQGSATPVEALIVNSLPEHDRQLLQAGAVLRYITEDLATLDIGRDISNVFRRVPGVVANNIDQGDTGNGFRMRGFATQGTHGADTAIYIDGVPQNIPSSQGGAGHGPAFLEWMTGDMIDTFDVMDAASLAVASGWRLRRRDTASCAALAVRASRRASDCLRLWMGGKICTMAGAISASNSTTSMHKKLSQAAAALP